MNKSNFEINQKYTTIYLVCSRCFHTWTIMKIDADGAYSSRVKENVCWECEPEGW